MKKIVVLMLTALVCCGLYAQDAPEFLTEPGQFAKNEGPVVTSRFKLAFPMYFGWTTMVGLPGGFPEMRTGKSFDYSLDLCSYNLYFGAARHHKLSLAARMDFMNFGFEDAYRTIYRIGDTYVTGITTGTNGRSSMLHANYMGVPLTYSFRAHHMEMYAGISAEFLLSGYALCRDPKIKTFYNSCFNKFRSALEVGVSYWHLGMFMKYSLTPLFSGNFPEGGDARTLTFGILLGL